MNEIVMVVVDNGDKLIVVVVFVNVFFFFEMVFFVMVLFVMSICVGDFGVVVWYWDIFCGFGFKFIVFFVELVVMYVVVMIGFG